MLPITAVHCKSSLLLFAALGLGLLSLGIAPPNAVSHPAVAAPGEGVCVVADPPEYYKIALVSTKRIPGTRQAEGTGYVTFARSPFGIAVSPEGSYVYDLSVSVERLKPPTDGVYVAWVSTPDLDRIERLGVLDADSQAEGRVQWNKYLVIVTLEPSAETLGATWQGPVVLRGMSRSGLMHTMAGHGPFQQEPCATYGYN